MKVQFVFLALMLSFIFEFTYFFFLQYIQKKRNKKLARITNTFLYEITPRFNENTSFINYLMLFGVTVSLFPFIYYLAYNIQFYSVTIAIIAIILIFTLCCIPFIGLDKLREHLLLDVTSLVLLLSLAGMEAFYGFQLFRLYRSYYDLAAMIVALVLFVLALAMIVNPKLFDLKNDIDEQGNPKRKKVIYLALTEWLLYPRGILTLIPLILICVK